MSIVMNDVTIIAILGGTVIIVLNNVIIIIIIIIITIYAQLLKSGLKGEGKRS